VKRLAAATILVVTILTCAPAFGGTWSAPGDAALSGSLVKGAGAWLELPWSIVWQCTTNEPRSVERLANGNTLVARGYMRVVEEISPAGTVVWEYREDESFAPWHATRLAGGNTLIVSRRAGEVIEVDRAGQVVWRYGGADVAREIGVTLVPGYPGYLQDPFSATRLPNGHTLICDNQGGLVLEVRTSDYDPAQLNDGYTADSVIWSCAPGGTGWPKTAQRLANGNTLIAASEFVIEVDPGGAPTWQPAAGLLREPISAYRLDDGSTLVAEEKSTGSTAGRVVRLNPAGDIVWEFSTLSLLGLEDIGLSSPRRAVPGTDGSILIADEDNNRLIELGRAFSGTSESAQLDCELPGARKQFTSLAATIDAPTGTSATVSYAIDGGPWQTLSGTTLPAGTFGTRIAYRVALSTTRRDITPRLLGVSIGYEAAPAQPNGPPGTGTGSGSTGTAGGTGTGKGAGGTMSGAGGYTTGGTLPSSSIVTGALSTQRGWTMARVGPSVAGGASGDGSPGETPGANGAPAPGASGLLVLGTLYGFGLLSVPLQHLTALLLRRPLAAP